MRTIRRQIPQLVIDLLAKYADPYVHADIGARRQYQEKIVELLPQSIYIGFEPDIAECEALCRKAGDNYMHLPVAVGKVSEKRKLHITHNPACASLLLPNFEFLHDFLDSSPFEVIGSCDVETVALDTYLPSVGIEYVDFLKIDTQGTELDVLQGAKSLLSSSLLGLKIEVEFLPIYQKQPLFSDVDAYVRQHGFLLFDMMRYRFRRKTYPRDLETRGQLVYGDAFYLKDLKMLKGPVARKQAIKLLWIAIFHGFHDYGLDILGFILEEGTGSLAQQEKIALEKSRKEYVNWLTNKGSARLSNVAFRVQQSYLGGLFQKSAKLCEKVVNVHRFLTLKRKARWRD